MKIGSEAPSLAKFIIWAENKKNIDEKNATRLLNNFSDNRNTIGMLAVKKKIEDKITEKSETPKILKNSDTAKICR